MDDREIELIHYIRVLWRQKWIILTTLAVALVSAWLLSEVPEPTYRASASLLLMPSLASELDEDSIGSLLPGGAYAELGSSTTVLQQIHDETKFSTDFTLEELGNSLSITSKSYPTAGGESRAQPVLLALAVRGTDPEELAVIASTWIQAFTDAYGSLFEDRIARSYNYVLTNYQLTETELARVIEERLSFLHSHNLEVLRIERDVLKAHLVSSQALLDAANLELNTTTAYLASQTTLSFDHGSSTVLSDQIDPFTLAGALLLGFSGEQFERLLSSRIQVLQSDVLVLHEELPAKQRAVDAAEIGLQELDRRIALLSGSVDFLSARLQAAKLALAETPDPILVIDEPLVSDAPISPKMTTNLSVAGVLGIMVGTLLAFLIDYLRRVREGEQATRAVDSSGTDGEENSVSDDVDDGQEPT